MKMYFAFFGHRDDYLDKASIKMSLDRTIKSDKSVKDDKAYPVILRSAFEKMYKIRVFETECIKLYRQGLIRGYFHPYLGEEVYCCWCMRST